MNVRFRDLIFMTLFMASMVPMTSVTIGCSGKKDAKKELNSIEKTVDAITSTISGTSPVVADGVGSSIVTITLKDSSGNPVAQVTPQFAATDSGELNSYSACTVSNAEGVSVCAFSSKRAESKILSLTFPVTVADENQIVFTHGPATKLSVYYQPTAIIVNQKWGSPMIKILDANDNLVTTGADATADLSVTIGSGSGNITGTTTVAAVDGVATFKNLRYNKTDTFTFVATKEDTSGEQGTVSSSVTSSPIKMYPNTATRVGFATQPGGGTAGVAWSQQPIVEIRDVGGNLVPTATNEVTLILTSGSGLLLGTITKTAVDGVATFSDLYVQLAGTDKILTAISGTLTPAQSEAFTITAAEPSILNFTTQPGGGTAGVAWTQQPAIELLDQFGNLCLTSTDVVSLALSTGTGTLSGSASVNAIAGVATFSGLSLNLSGSDKILTASSGSATPAVSGAFAITPAAVVASSSVIASHASRKANGSEAVTITVTLVDQYSNPVPDKTVSLGSSRGGDDSISAPAATNSSGVANFTVTSLSLGASTFTATDTSDSLQLTTQPSVTFTDYIASALTSTWSVAKVSVAADNSTMATISAIIKNAAGAALPGKTIALSSSRGATDTIAGSPATSDASGNVSFTVKSSTVGEPTLTMAVDETGFDTNVISSSILVSFLGATPYADFQTRLANSSISSMGPGVNSPTATNTWMDLFNLGPNNGSLAGFAYNDTASGWATTTPYHLIFDGTDDRVNFGTGINSLSNLSLEALVKIPSPTTGNKFIFSNGDVLGKGLSIRTVSDNSGKAILTIGGDNPYVNEILSDSPTAYYRLGESSGSTAIATVGSNGSYNGVSGVNYIFGQTTAINDNNKSVRFDGLSGYMLPDNISQATDFTIEAWVYLEEINRLQAIAAKQDGSVGYALEITASNQIKMTVSGTSGVPTFYSVTGASTLSINTWYHVVGVRDGTNSELRVYLNAVLDNTSIGLTGTAENSSILLRIGGDENSAGREFNGRIDDVAIYSSVLSSTRISTHYSARSRFACMGSSVLNLSNFTHLVGTFNDSTDALKLYVNGVEECSVIATGTSISGSNYPLAAGASINDSSGLVSNSAIQARIGDLRVYDLSLDQTAITNNYNAVCTRFSLPSCPP